MDDFANAISYELKKEIADRYFGFRFQIETESKKYSTQVEFLRAEFDNTVRREVQKLETILHEQDTILAFSLLVGLPHNDDIFNSLVRYGPTLSENNFLKNCSFHGWTRKSRYKNLVYDTYSSLEKQIGNYMKKYNLLIEEHKDLGERVTTFSRNNDLSLILSLLQRIDCADHPTPNMLYSNPSPNIQNKSHRGMDIHLPDSVEKKLPALTSIPPLKIIRKQLNKLIDKTRIYQKFEPK